MKVSDELAARIVKNWGTFRELLEEVVDREGLTQMLDHFENRAPFTPASSKLRYHNACPGGLIEHSLRVLTIALKLNEAMGMSYSKEQLILCSLLHDWGKVGDLENDNYVPQESDWHRERGMMYTYSDKGLYMDTTDRTLYLLHHFQVPLSKEEWLAIRLADGQYVEGNKSYGMREPNLAHVIHTADRTAALLETDRASILNPID